jgi:protein tyrosine/serine phosphatase
MKRFAVCLLAGLAAPAFSQEPAGPPAVSTPSRPAHWAEAITLEGVPNLHRLTPMLYRSEQPTALGMQNLEKLGIRTVINLRAFNDDDEEVRGTQLRTERTRILTWRVDDKHVIEVMRMLRNADKGPFLIHCQHGADRTGLMSAMYRMLEQGWKAEDALAELTEGGYGYHSMWRNIRRYVSSVDVEKLRAAIGATSAPPAR